MCSSSRRSSFPFVLLVILLVGGACTNSGDVDVADGDAGVPAEVDGDSGDGQSEESSTSPSASVALPTDPVGGELVYSCAGRRFAIDDLLEMADGASPTESEASEAGFDVASLGDLDEWVMSADGVLIARMPLDTDPPALVIAEPALPPFACVALRAGGFELRSIAWERLGDELLVESCVDPSEVVVDEREVGGQTVIALFGPFVDLPPESRPSCLVDGSSKIDNATTDSLSSLTFPFVPASARTWQILGFGDDVAPLDASSLGVIECRTAEQPTEVFVEWSSIAPGFDVTVVADGRDLYTTEGFGFEDSATMKTALNEFLDQVGASSAEEPENDGFENGFSDFVASIDEPQSYEIRVAGGGIEPLVIGCGEAALLPGGPTSDSTTPPSSTPSGDTSDLAAARDLFASRAVSPFAYFRVVALCAECDSSALDLQMLPSGDPAGPSLEFSPSLAEQAPGAAGSVIINPFELHDALLDAENAGRDVTYTLDASSGIPTRWTIDGEGGEIQCFEVDTAPPELRSGQQCEIGRDLIGG